MILPIFQTADRILSLMQTRWKSIIDPIISAPQNNSSIVSQIVNGASTTLIPLINGTNTIFHGLGRPLQGWSFVRIDGAASVYDQQTSNPNPSQTLILVSNAAVNVTIEVF